MADIERQNFEVVRRGYDIDQVDEFLVRQAEAWRNELYDARRRIAELEGDLTRLGALETEVEQARRQQDALTMTLQTAAQARDEMLAKAEQDVAVLRSEAEQQVEDQLSEAKVKSAEMVAEAEQEANDVRHQSRMRTDELMMAQEEQLSQRRSELDTAHAEAKGRYEIVEATMASKIKDLNSMREALVTGLEAIASGGLAALEEVSDVLADVGIVGNDDTAVKSLLESNDGPSTGTPPLPGGPKTLASGANGTPETQALPESTGTVDENGSSSGNTYGADATGSSSFRTAAAEGDANGEANGTENGSSDGDASDDLDDASDDGAETINSPA